jgi:uncharacterized protein (TIGR02271 family)
MALTVIGIFDQASEAQQAVDQLVSAGFSRQNIDLSAQTSQYQGDQTSQGLIPDRHQNTSGTRTEEVIDDTKDVGSDIGRFFSSLFGDDDDTRNTYSRVADQGSVVTVHAQTEDEAGRAADILDEAGAVDVNEKSAQYGYASAGTATSAAGGMTNQPTTDSGQTIQVVEENLEVCKRTVETGGVRLRSRIVARPVEESVRLREERVTLQRTPVNRPATAADLNAFQEGQIELHETAERAVVSRTANVVEEISVGKEVTEREEVIRDTVRKTEVDVEQLSSTEQPIRTGLTGTEGDEVTYSSR